MLWPAAAFLPISRGRFRGGRRGARVSQGQGPAAARVGRPLSDTQAQRAWRNRFLILPQRGAPHCAVLNRWSMAALPVRAAIITDAARLDPTARYIMRLWMARQRRRLAIRRNDPLQDNARPKRSWSCLLANPPSLDRRARNIRSHNVTKQAETEKWKAKCQAEAARID